MKDKEPRELTPAEQLFQRLEKPLGTVDNATDVNNDMVRLFTEGQLNISELIKSSTQMARRVDELAAKILKTDPRKVSMPETKPFVYTAMLNLAVENRHRAISLTVEQQRVQQKSQMQPHGNAENSKPPGQK